MRKRTKGILAACLALALAVVALAAVPAPAYAASTQNMYRLYNPNSGEHFYTGSMSERDNVRAAGWKYEGVGWTAPASSNTPVHRLYNPNAGDHHYTMSASERDMLVGVGWTYEGVGWYSDDAEAVPLYRQYNPNARAGAHNYTTDKSENDNLVKLGWRAEGIGWYGVKAETVYLAAYSMTKVGTTDSSPTSAEYLAVTDDTRTLTTTTIDGTAYTLKQVHAPVDTDSDAFDHASSPWATEDAYYNGTIKYVEILDNVRPERSYLIFRGLMKLEEIVGIEKLDTSCTTSMSRMFDSCMSLTSLDLSHFDSSQVSSMNEMFVRCTNLKTITYGPKFVKKDSSVDVSYMFTNCPANKPSWWTD